jgi:hypothetical protein
LLPAGEQPICMARRQTAWGPRLLTVRTGHPHSTISNVLKRNGLSQPPRVARALAVFAARGVAAKRLLTDNAWAYTRNRSLRELLAERGVRHLTTGPRRPRTNANWLTASATAPLDTAARRCHTGSATTTSADRTARSAACPRSARSQRLCAGQLAVSDDFPNASLFARQSAQRIFAAITQTGIASSRFVGKAKAFPPPEPRLSAQSITDAADCFDYVRAKLLAKGIHVHVDEVSRRVE